MNRGKKTNRPHDKSLKMPINTVFFCFIFYWSLFDGRHNRLFSIPAAPKPRLGAVYQEYGRKSFVPMFRRHPFTNAASYGERSEGE